MNENEEIPRATLVKVLHNTQFPRFPSSSFSFFFFINIVNNNCKYSHALTVVDAAIDIPSICLYPQALLLPSLLRCGCYSGVMHT